MCPVETTLSIIGGKWKPVILYHLRLQTRRFNELQKMMPNISHKVLSQQLQELEQDGIVRRTAYDELPLRVEYSLTEYGRTLTPILEAMSRWGSDHEALLKQQEIS